METIDTTQTRVYTSSRSRSAAYLAVSLVFVAITWFTDPLPYIAGKTAYFVPFLLFSLMALYFALRLIAGSPRLIASPQGLTVWTLLSRQASSWSDIRRLGTYRHKTSQGIKVIAVNYKTPARLSYRRWLRSRYHASIGWEMVVPPPGLIIDADELLPILKAYYQAYKDTKN